MIGKNIRERGCARRDWSRSSPSGRFAARRAQDDLILCGLLYGELHAPHRTAAQAIMAPMSWTLPPASMAARRPGFTVMAQRKCSAQERHSQRGAGHAGDVDQRRGGTRAGRGHSLHRHRH